MASIQSSASFSGYVPQTEAGRFGVYQEVFAANRHRIYALAFWMTNNQLRADELMKQTFSRAFALNADPSAEFLDRTLIVGLRELMPLGELSLNCDVCTTRRNVRRNTMRVHLELAIVQVPPTERLVFLLHDVENYHHQRIGQRLGLNQKESQFALHQARLRIRELLATMA